MQRNNHTDQNMLLGYRDADRGHILENIVLLELIRRGYRVYIGKVGETEILSIHLMELNQSISLIG